VIDDLPLVLTLAAFALHLLGERRAVVLTGRPRGQDARRRAGGFYAALAVIVIALESPIDSLADKLFWAHMVQHLLLLVVAAPLIAWSRPWMSIWRPVPLSARRKLARTAVRSRYLSPLRALFRALSSPAGAWIAFNANMIFWHLPGPYDLMLRNLAVHVLEHTSFIAFGVLFWAQVIGATPASSVLSLQSRIAYVAGSMVSNIGLSVYLAFAQHPLYSPYAALVHRPGGISALADQQIGAGIMWTAGDMPFAVAIAVLAHQWFTRGEALAARLSTVLAGAVEHEPSGRA
jgi:putative membrane protein